MRHGMAVESRRRGSRRRRRENGFTLIEMLATIVVAGLLLAIAIPSFTQVTVSNELTSVANTLVGSIDQARVEAVKRNSNTQFCSNVATNNGTDALGTACGVSAGAVYVSNTDGSTTELQNGLSVSSALSIGNGSNGGAAITALRFAGDGLGQLPTGTAPYTGLVADVYSTRIGTDNHRCIYLITGSVVSSCPATNNCPVNEPSTCQ